MGCCYRKGSDFTEIDEVLDKTTAELQMTQIELSKYKDYFVPLKKYLFIDDENLKKILEVLKINEFSLDYKILNQLKSESQGKTSAHHLYTFFIVFGIDNRENKIKEIFSNFDKNHNNRLTPDDVDFMVNCFYDVIIDKFLFAVYKSFEEEMCERLFCYRMKLLQAKNNVISYLFHFFADGANFINFDRFLELFQRPECEILLSPKLFRSFAFRIYQTITKLPENQSEQGQDVNIQKMRRFTKRISSKYQNNLLK